MRIVVFIFFIYTNIAKCQDSSRQAIAYTQKAILAYPQVKKQAKNLEKKLVSYIPLEKEYVITTGSIGMAVIRGRVETKPIKNMDIDLMGGRARPDVFWDFRGKDAGVYFNIMWGF